MAKYNVQFACGHTETIQLFGKESDRAKKIAWLTEHGVCSACYKARIDAERAAETAAAAEKAAEENLPDLTGSDKQINWALAIRAQKFADLDKMVADMTTTDEQLRRQNTVAIQAAKNVLATKTESRFWIDNRNVAANRLIAQNNLQDDLKAEFAKLAAEEETAENKATEEPAEVSEEKIEVTPDEYVVSEDNTGNNQSIFITKHSPKSAVEPDDMTETERLMFFRKKMTRRESFLEARREVFFDRDKRGVKRWYIRYPVYNIYTGDYSGHKLARKATQREVKQFLIHNYFKFNIDDFLAEQKAWDDEEVHPKNINAEADHISDKVHRDAQTCDNQDDVFALLPDVDKMPVTK